MAAQLAIDPVAVAHRLLKLTLGALAVEISHRAGEGAQPLGVDGGVAGLALGQKVVLQARA